jgi:hypothetical protein
MRYYSNVAQAATVANAGGISTGTTNLVLSGTNGMPVSFPFTLRIDPDTSNEELVSVTSGAGTVGTPYVVTRGFDGTSAKSHTVGAPVVHSGSAIDFREPQEHMANVTPGGVHGLPTSAWYNRVTVFKSSDQGYNNDATLNDDLDLKVNLLANTDYEVSLYAICSGVGGNIKIAWKVPAGCTGIRSCLGPTEASNNRDDTNMRTGASLFATEVKYGLGSFDFYSSIQEKAIIRVGATAGQFVIQHAQATSHADVSTMRAFSYMIVTRISL